MRLDFLIFCPFSASKLSYNFLKIDQELLNRGANFNRLIKSSYKVEAHSFLKTFLIFTKYQPRLSYSDFLIKKTECSKNYGTLPCCHSKVTLMLSECWNSLILLFSCPWSTRRQKEKLERKFRIPTGDISIVFTVLPRPHRCQHRRRHHQCAV